MRSVIAVFAVVAALTGVILFGGSYARDRAQQQARARAVAQALAQQQAANNRLAQNVSAYNDLLLESSHAAEDTRDALDQLQTTVQVSPERITHEGDRLAPRVKQNIATLTRDLSQALTMSEALHADPLFRQQYVDGDLAVPADDIPDAVKDKGADALRFAVSRTAAPSPR